MSSIEVMRLEFEHDPTFIEFITKMTKNNFLLDKNYKIIKMDDTTVVYDSILGDNDPHENKFILNKINDAFLTLGTDFNVIIFDTIETIDIEDIIEKNNTDINNIYENIPWNIRYSHDFIRLLIANFKGDLSFLYDYIEDDSEFLYDLTFLYNVYTFNNEVRNFHYNEMKLSDLYNNINVILLWATTNCSNYNNFLLYIKNKLIVDFNDVNIYVKYQINEFNLQLTVLQESYFENLHKLFECKQYTELKTLEYILRASNNIYIEGNEVTEMTLKSWLFESFLETVNVDDLTLNNIILILENYNLFWTRVPDKFKYEPDVICAGFKAIKNELKQLEDYYKVLLYKKTNSIADLYKKIEEKIKILMLTSTHYDVGYETIINELKDDYSKLLDNEKNILTCLYGQINKKIFMRASTHYNVDNKTIGAYDYNYQEYLNPIDIQKLSLESLIIILSHYGNYHKSIPEEFKYDKYDEKILKATLSSKGDMIQYIPEQYITSDLVKIAVSNNGLAIKHLAKKYKFEKSIVELAIENNGCCIEYIPYKLLKIPLILKAIDSHHMAYQYLVKTGSKLKNNNKIIKAATIADRRNIKYMSDKNKKEINTIINTIPSEYKSYKDKFGEHADKKTFLNTNEKYIKHFSHENTKVIN